MKYYKSNYLRTYRVFKYDPVYNESYRYFIIDKPAWELICAGNYAEEKAAKELHNFEEITEQEAFIEIL